MFFPGVDQPDVVAPFGQRPAQGAAERAGTEHADFHDGEATARRRIGSKVGMLLRR